MRSPVINAVVAENDEQIVFAGVPLEAKALDVLVVTVLIANQSRKLVTYHHLLLSNIYRLKHPQYQLIYTYNMEYEPKEYCCSNKTHFLYDPVLESFLRFLSGSICLCSHKVYRKQLRSRAAEAAVTFAGGMVVFGDAERKEETLHEFVTGSKDKRGFGRNLCHDVPLVV